MKRLFKTTLVFLTILSFFVTVSYAGISGSDFDVYIQWDEESPEIGDDFTFKFNPDGTFEIPDLGDEKGDYTEIPIFSIPHNPEITWFETNWEDPEERVNIWGSLFDLVFTLPETGLPVMVQAIAGNGELIMFRDGNETYYPFTFSGYKLSEEKMPPKFLRVVPEYGLQGEEDKDITIFCSNTKFMEQSPCVAFENRGIKINGITSVNDISLTVNIDIEEYAPRGKGDIIISLSDGSTITCTNAFEVRGDLQKLFLDKSWFRR